MGAWSFDAVLFDLDGTLVATDRFWIQAARTGARRAFAELGFEREPPSAEDWMRLVGLPAEEGYRGLFPECSADERRAIRLACEEEEQRLIASGGAALMPGAERVLQELSLAGLCLGIASNCSRAYLESVLSSLGLVERIDAALCLESEGIHDKTEMVERLLERFGTRSALMVGDRLVDRDAAWANGLPHVHCDFGFAPAGETIEAEARIEDLGELPDLLGRRAAWIDGALRRSGALGAEPPFVLGITGEAGAGKSLFARDAARRLAAAGVRAQVLDAERFRRPATRAATSTVEEHYDLGRLEPALLGPSDEVLIVEGPFLLDPRLHSRLDRAIYLDAPEAVRWRRLSGRERSAGSEALVRLRADLWPREREHRARYAPEKLADLVLDAGNALGPAHSLEGPAPGRLP